MPDVVRMPDRTTLRAGSLRGDSGTGPGRDEGQGGEAAGEAEEEVVG